MFARCRKPYTTRMSSQEPQQKILPQSDSYCSIPNLKIERKICRRLLTSSFKREIRKFYVAVRVKETAKKCTKQCDTSTKLLFSLSDGGEGGRAVVLFSQFAPPPPIVLALLRDWACFTGKYSTRKFIGAYFPYPHQ